MRVGLVLAGVVAVVVGIVMLIAYGGPPPPLPRGCPGDMVRIPAGEFLMGSAEGQGGAGEHPQHRVAIGAFCIDRTEVTVAAFRACVTAGRCERPLGLGLSEASVFCNWGREGAEDHPINCVDWGEAKTFCEWSGLAGGARRLPREAEWEFAARGSADRTYPWGEQAPDGARANLCGDECVRYAQEHAVAPWGQVAGWRDEYGATAPVTAFPAGATPEGLLNMGGNVWEWAADEYTAGAYAHHNAQGAGVAWQEMHGGDYRVIRGGGWDGADASRVRAATRDGYGSTGRRTGLGFRCARTSR